MFESNLRYRNILKSLSLSPKTLKSRWKIENGENCRWEIDFVAAKPGVLINDFFFNYKLPKLYELVDQRGEIRKACRQALKAYLSFCPTYYFEDESSFPQLWMKTCCYHLWESKIIEIKIQTELNVFSIIVLPKINFTSSLKASRHLISIPNWKLLVATHCCYHREISRGFL